MLDERCHGCKRIGEANPYGAFLSCMVYPNPEKIWRLMRDGAPCPMATHIKVETAPDKKVRVGQQKQKKG